MKHFDWLSFGFGVLAMVGYNLVWNTYDLLTAPKPTISTFAPTNDSGLAPYPVPREGGGVDVGVQCVIKGQVVCECLPGTIVTPKEVKP